jgi:photosystem II stability/assembly factor-like uncharacterized protein
MTRNPLRRWLACILLLTTGAVTNLAISSEKDIEYAEHQVLAAHSLLLDVVRHDDHFVAVGERGHIVISHDMEQWVQAEIVPTRSTLTTVIRAGDRLWAAGHDSVILTSGDHGKNWTRMYFDSDRNQPIMDIVFFDQQRGMAIGAYGLALFTSDGGESWEDRVISEDEWHLNAALNLGNGRLLIAGEAGFSYRSIDYGQSWETLEMPYPGSMFSIISSSDECVMVFGLRGHAQESCDFGEQWTELDVGSELTLSGGVRSADGVILVGNSGVIVQRDASGVFSAAYHSSGVDFASISQAGQGQFLLTGEDGIHRFPETQAAGGDQ